MFKKKLLLRKARKVQKTLENPMIIEYNHR